MTTQTDELTTFEDEINNRIPIPKRWRKYIVEEFKRQASAIDEIEDIRRLILSWKWITRPQQWVWETINMLDLFPATTTYLLSINYVFERGIESEAFGKREEKKLASRFRRAIHRLFQVNLISAIHLEPDQVGAGRKSVTIWVSPFAKKKDIEKTKRFYLAMGGIPGTVAKQQKKTPKEIAQHNIKVQAYHTLHKYTFNPHLFVFYRCPKKHPRGLKRTNKINSPYKKKITTYTCDTCNRSLIEITHEEFMKLKEKSLLEDYASLFK
jgi:hypothetical protein